MDKYIGQDRTFEVLKEPRGFIKLLEFLFAILAFATTTNYGSSVDFTAECNNTSHDLHFPISYPFRLDEYKGIKKDPCSDTSDPKTFFGDFSSNAQFYVFIGVMSMLYSLAALVLYIFYSSKYEQTKMIKKIDLIITGVFSFGFFISSVAWSFGVSNLKYYSSFDQLVGQLTDGSTHNFAKFDAKSIAVFGGLNVSLIFGYFNCFLWASNMWFIVKELRKEPDSDVENASAPNDMK
ncbi:hypothetical protein Ciccas_001131 [Cichlidogyrus casuarinus]|uniref:MARVEL domain-containing protein n=1 Tax=Cichlidogyrus casuarinus TaxID=1844966 RepID=A0ABD2QKX7_9PLAT